MSSARGERAVNDSLESRVDDVLVYHRTSMICQRHFVSNAGKR